jgi:hypothetical protein
MRRILFTLSLFILLNCNSYENKTTKWRINQNHNNNQVFRIIELLGKWNYVKSNNKDTSLILPTNKYLPINSFIIEPCNDSIELKSMNSKFVIESRKSNILKNIRVIFMDQNNSVIDTFYPILTQDTNIRIDNYGRKIKTRFTIYDIDSISMIISDGRVYDLPSKSIRELQHLYLKNK